MRVRWYGQSAFRLQARDGRSVLIDPFGAVASALAARGLRFEYPPITDATADLVLVTHEHVDHNAVGVVGGAPRVLRSTAGRFASPVGPVLAVAAEHDDVAGTRGGPNTLFAFSLEGRRVCHLGDLGQSALRPEQRAAIGSVDLLFVPVGGRATIGARAAIDVVRQLRPTWVVPMHYRTPAVDFLEPVDAFLEGFRAVYRCAGSTFDTSALPAAEPDGPLIVVPAVPA